jgi:hypothetical protein
MVIVLGVIIISGIIMFGKWKLGSSGTDAGGNYY